MKILYLNHNIKGEGTYFRAFNFARELAALGHEMTLITVGQKNRYSPVESTDHGVRVIESPRFWTRDGGGWAPFDVGFRKLFVLREKFDIIHAFDHKPNVFIPALLGRMAHSRTVLFSDWADWWGKGGINAGGRAVHKIFIEEFLEEDIRRRADGLTVTSHALEQRALALGIKREKLFYIPSGCVTDRIRPAGPEEAAQARQELGIPQGKKLIMFIGFGQADLGIMIEGFEKARKQRDDIMLVIVGPLEQKHEARVAQCSHREDILITGKVDFKVVARYASIADIYLMPLSDTPANRGRGPMKIGDYMAGGKPVIANPVGDIKEWMEQYKFGLLAGYNGEETGARMLELLANPGLASELGANGRKAAEGVFAWQLMGELMEKAYKAINN